MSLTTDLGPWTAKWFSRLVGTGVGLGGGAIAKMTWYVTAIFALAGALLIAPAGYRAWRKAVHDARPVEFYQDEGEKGEARGDLKEELSGIRRVWLAFETGNYLAMQSPDVLPKEEVRIILCDPSHAYIDNHCRVYSADTPEQARHIIEKAIAAVGPWREAGHKHISLKVCPGPIMNAVIMEPRSRVSEVRIHYQLYGHRPVDWPDIALQWQKTPVAVENAEAAFERMWRHGRDPYKEARMLSSGEGIIPEGSTVKEPNEHVTE